MAEIEFVDATWIDRPRQVVSRLLNDPARWRGWWPALVLERTEDRGPDGVRWRVPSADRGRLCGSMEVWLQPVDGGTVAHYILWLDGAGRPLRRRERARRAEAHRRRGREVMWSVADELDPDRLARLAAPSTPSTPSAPNRGAPPSGGRNPVA